jgi:Tol biopolymer transport system component
MRRPTLRMRRPTLRMRRRTLLIAGAIVILVAAAAGVGLALTRDGDDSPKLPGRIAVIDGCGLKHMWSDGTDQRELCLPGVWESVTLSFNGKTLAWDSSKGSQSGIMIAKSDASDQRQLPLPGTVNVAPTLSPDGRRLAFLHSAADDGRYDVWSTDATSTSDVAEQVTAVHNVSFVAWSPKDDWLAYVKDWSEETLEGKIMLVRPNGDDEHLLGTGDQPAWAPDGKTLAFVHAGSLWRVARDGSQRRPLTRNGEAPAWSRDGKQVAFMREEKCGGPDCKERVFLVFADGSGPRSVGPRFSPGHRLLWLPDPNE